MYSEQGDLLFAKGELQEAAYVYGQALSLIPKPENNPVDYSNLLVNRATINLRLKVGLSNSSEGLHRSHGRLWIGNLVVTQFRKSLSVAWDSIEVSGSISSQFGRFHLEIQLKIFTSH